MIVRPMLFTDLSAVLQLGRSLFREEDEVPDLRIALHRYDPSRSYVCSTDDAEIIGFAIVCCRSLGCYELAFLGVSARHHGRGIGSRLLYAVLDTLTAPDVCWLLVDVDNHIARAMYEKAGFHAHLTMEYTSPKTPAVTKMIRHSTPANAIASVG
jgi:ribosomal protein S18 acetylase RimI-like enzyme